MSHIREMDGYIHLINKYKKQIIPPQVNIWIVENPLDLLLGLLIWHN